MAKTKESYYEKQKSEYQAVRLKKDTFRKLKIHCAEEGRTVIWALNEAVKDYLDDTRKG